MASLNIAAIAAAQARRGASNRDVRIDSFVDQVANKMVSLLQQRVVTAVSLLRNRIVQNINVLVKKEKSSRTGRIIVTERSKKGEFPRADTTQLMKTIFSDVISKGRGTVEGYVGTPLDYGLILETSKRLDRGFLVRTLNQERSRITKILIGPIR